MKTLVAASIIIAVTGVVTACVPYQKTRVLEANERVITYTKRDNLDVMCSEPSPDALKTLAGSLSVKKENVAALAVAFQESGANIGVRTHTIQLLRDQLFSICQAYANKEISAGEYQMLLTRNQRNTIALMAIEQLTGVVRGPNVTLSGSALVRQAEDVVVLNEQLAKAEAQRKNVADGTETAKALDSTIRTLKTSIDTANANIGNGVAVTGAASSQPSTTQVDTEAIKTIADKVEKIVYAVTDVNDLFYLCLQNYANKSSIEQALMPKAFRERCDKVFAETPDSDVRFIGGLQ